MPRPTHPRSEYQHALKATEILTRHARKAATTIALPVPIDMIIEQTFGLQILWDDISESPGIRILGALNTKERLILLNSRHQHLFDEFIGPERFTLAHELAHWVYDADDPAQLAMDLGELLEEQYCYPGESHALSENDRIREVNANKLAAHLLLPENLVRQAATAEVLRDVATAARKWGVSQTTLRIRLQGMGLLD